MSLDIGGSGNLSFAVWPVYVGACTEDPGVPPLAFGEPTDPSYERGQISYGHEVHDNVEQIVGRAFIKAPEGRYTHLAYFSGPEGACMTGKVQLPHPIVFVGPDNTLEVYPITNDDLKLLKTQGRDY
jgi:hypothetical protein